MDIIYRKVKKEDAETYWKLRLNALKDSPDSFAFSYEESSGRTIEEVTKRINEEKDNYILAAFDGNQAIGMAGFQRENVIKISHKSWIWGVYVEPKYRGQGIAKYMMEEILRNARLLDGLKHIKLDVASHNEKAKGLYIGLGFEKYGYEKDALYVNGKFIDEEFMVKFL